MLSAVKAGALAPLLACLLAAAASGCGSSSKPVPTSPEATLLPMRLCLRHHGYSVTPESASVMRTAPASFEFVAVWDLLNPARVAVTLTVSRSAAGAARVAVWTRRENAKIGKGVVVAPVVQLGRIDLLWTAKPGRGDTSGVDVCVRPDS